MRRKANTLRAAIAAATIAPAAALAQVDTSDWKCEYCPFEDDYAAEYEAGFSNVGGDDGYRFGNGTGYDDEGLYAEIGSRGRYAGDRTIVSWNIDKLGLDSRGIDVAFDRPGAFSAYVGFDALPYRRFDTTSSVFGISGGSLSLPDNWTTAGTTGGFADLAASSQTRAIESDRETLKGGFAWMPGSNVDVYADYRRQERDGVRIMSGSTFGQAAYLPRVIDDETDTIDAGVRFALGDLNLNLSWYGSFYRNNIGSLTWDNPFTAIPGTGTMQMATEPDSDFTQVSLSGIWRTDALNTTIAFSAALGRGEQTDALLPYTINTNLSGTSLPVSALDGEVDSSKYALTLTSKPLKKARVKVALRYDERNNGTPILNWSRVIVDSFVSGDVERNIPHSYDRTRLSVSGSYRLFDTVSVYAGYDRTELDRDFQEVAEQTIDSGWGKLRWRPTAWLEATFKGGGSRREINEYDQTVAQSFGQNPLMRKYHLAHRLRDFGEVNLSASLPELPVSVGLTALYAKDDYSQSQLGMLESEENRWTFDVNWAPSENTSIYLVTGSEAIEATQAASETFIGPDWGASHDDDFSHVGGGFSVTSPDDEVGLAFDYSRGEGETEILFNGPSVSATPLPELDSTLESMRLTLSFNRSERLSWDLVVRYEAFETTDWALDGVLADTIPSVLTMGAESYNYDIWAVGLGFRYRTGADDAN